MQILSVNNLRKEYEKFTLDNVSFSLDKGYIMGFIGRNGAGKTTTLKTMLGLVHPDGGRVEICGRDFAANEMWCKNKIGFMSGGISYYPQKKLKAIAGVTKRFYENWDEAAYRDYLERFELDENKKVVELSEGMKVKFALSLALSHNAELLILDEPTSGLDPVSRDDLIELFQSLIEDGQRSILFSTHITSDLDKCADYITYIKSGKVIASTEKDTLIDEYRLISGKKEQLTPQFKEVLIGFKENPFGFTGLIHTSDMKFAEGCESAKTTLEEIMLHLEKNDEADR